MLNIDVAGGFSGGFIDSCELDVSGIVRLRGWSEYETEKFNVRGFLCVGVTSFYIKYFDTAEMMLRLIRWSALDSLDFVSII